MIFYILSAVLIIILLGYFIFRNPKSESLSRPSSVSYKTLLEGHVAWYQKLNPVEQERFEHEVEAFLNDTTIEGVGTEVTDLDKVLIASSAVIPVFGFPGWHYQNLTNVILYPDTFDKDFQFKGENRNLLGMVGTGYMNGQMLLSRAALQKGFSASAGKENTAIHEFIHLLDKSDGATDGIPENLLAHQYTIPWIKMMHQEMHRLSAGHSDINPYALTSDAEFLAVAGEYFFEKPHGFSQKHPELYQMLSRIFAQGPQQALMQQPE